MKCKKRGMNGDFPGITKLDHGVARSGANLKPRSYTERHKPKTTELHGAAQTQNHGVTRSRTNSKLKTQNHGVTRSRTNSKLETQNHGVARSRANSKPKIQNPKLGKTLPQLLHRRFPFGVHRLKFCFAGIVLFHHVRRFRAIVK